jgi:DNA-binding LacI/PurR family transcriptional regulator
MFYFCIINKTKQYRENMPRNQKNAARPNIRAVAQLAQLSPTTVSLALRNQDSIPPETRERVLVAAAKLNYQYKPRAAKSARRADAKPIRNLLYIVNDYGDTPLLANPFYGAILNGAVAASPSFNSYVHPVILQHDHPLDAPLPEALCNRPDGILLASPYPPALVKRIASEVECPMVLIDNLIPGSPYDTIMNDDFGGAYQAVQHLLELGHRYVHMIMGPLKKPGALPNTPPSVVDRYRGYSAAMLDGGHTPFPAIEIPLAYNQTISGRKELPQWLSGLLARAPRLTALFCNVDFYAVQIISALQSMGYRVPDDISVVGFDNLDIAQMIHPQLTTVHVNRSTMSQVAVERLAARMAGHLSAPLSIHVGARLIVRESTAAPAPVNIPA